MCGGWETHGKRLCGQRAENREPKDQKNSRSLPRSQKKKNPSAVSKKKKSVEPFCGKKKRRKIKKKNPIRKNTSPFCSSCCIGMQPPTPHPKVNKRLVFLDICYGVRLRAGGVKSKGKKKHSMKKPIAKHQVLVCSTCCITAMQLTALLG